MRKKELGLRKGARVSSTPDQDAFSSHLLSNGIVTCGMTVTSGIRLY